MKLLTEKLPISMKFFDFDRVLATIYERKNESFLTFRQIFFF